MFSTLQYTNVLLTVTASFSYLSLLQFKLSTALHNDAGKSGPHDSVVPVRFLRSLVPTLRHERVDIETLQSIVPGSILSIHYQF